MPNSQSRLGRRATSLTVSMVALLFTATACGVSNAEKPAESSEGDGENQVVQVGYVPTMAPFSYTEDGEPAGVDIELLKAAGEEVGIDFAFQEVSYDNMVPSIESGRIEVVTAGGLVDSEERRQSLDMVDYYLGEYAFAAQAGNPEGLGDGLDVCGTSVGTYTASETWQSALEAASEACEEAGEPPLNIDLYQDVPSGVSAVLSGRSDGFGDTLPFLIDVTEKDERLELVPSDVIPAELYAMGVTPKNPELSEKIATGLQNLVDSGQQEKIWSDFIDVPASALLDEITVNEESF